MFITPQKEDYRLQKCSLDYILQKRIGYGEAQNKLALPLYILLFTQGCESIVVSLLLSELQKQWGISNLQKSFLITVIFCGVGLGTYLQSYSDEFGRKIFIRRNAIFQTVCGLLSCVAPTMSFFILFRFCHGIGIGIAFPLSRKYISQITPSQSRLILLTKLRTYFAIGCLFAYIAAWYLLQNNHWRLLLLIICLPGIYALYQMRQNGKQSLKYLWLNNKYEQAYQLIKYMTNLNKKQDISREQIQHLIQIQHQNTLQQQIQYKDLLQSKYRNLTLSLMFGWFSVFFIYYGIFLFLPTIIQENEMMDSHDHKYLTLCTVVVFQVVCSLLSRPIMQHQMFGRKKTLCLSLFMVGLFSLSLMVTQQDDALNFIISFIGIKMFTTFAFMTMFPYTVQIYTVLLRKRSKGIFLASGRVGTVLLGFVGLNAIYCLDGVGLYLIFAILSITSAYLILKLPIDTLNRMSDVSFFFS